MTSPKITPDKADSVSVPAPSTAPSVIPIEISELTTPTLSVPTAAPGQIPDASSTVTAVFGGGCFWCTEAVFKMLKGVSSVTPGYAGGEKPDPTYEQVSTGTTGHAEVIKIAYDPRVLKYEDLLSVFFATHDPTTVNRQGNDIGTQYRSIILYSTGDQKEAAEKYIKELDEAKGPPIVTVVKPLDAFYEAEKEHKDYYERNPDQPYCSAVISPKVKKAKEQFAKLLQK